MVPLLVRSRVTAVSWLKYNVKVTFRYPAWDERDGYVVQVRARSKTDANRMVRRQAEDAGHNDITLRATEAAEEGSD